MLEQGAIDAAKGIYYHGKHAVIMTAKQKEPISLRTLATSSKRRQYVPSFSKFSSYFGDNDNYIHDEIVKLFEHTIGSKEQHTTMIVETLKYQVTFMAVLQRIYEAIAYCKSGIQAQSLQAVATWDIAAALMIGSMKREKDYAAANQSDGYLLFSLAEDLCSDFNTCGQGSSEAKSNMKILDALYSGSFELEQNSCSSVESVAARIEGQLLVPLIQGTLRAAYDNSQPEFDHENDVSFASGYVYSRAILPYIHSNDNREEGIIANNLNFQFTEKPVKDGYPRVFESVAKVLTELDVKISCSDIGFMSEANRGVCKSSGTTSDSTSFKPSLLVTTALIPIFIFLV